MSFRCCWWCRLLQSPGLVFVAWAPTYFLSLKQSYCLYRQVDIIPEMNLAWIVCVLLASAKRCLGRRRGLVVVRRPSRAVPIARKEMLAVSRFEQRRHHNTLSHPSLSAFGLMDSDGRIINIISTLREATTLLKSGRQLCNIRSSHLLPGYIYCV